jgi:outer membrane protein
MNKIVTRLLLALGLSTLLQLTAGAAEQKIAIIDLQSVFTNYFKTKIADAAIRDEAGALDKDRKSLTDQYQKLTEDYKKAIEDASNQAISADERDKRKKAAEGKLIEINDLEQQIKQFDRTARGNLEEKQRMAREKILTQIKSVVATKAQAGKYTMVLDTAGEGLSRTSVVFYNNGEHDITAEVLKALNADAPADLPKTDKK